MADRLSVLAVTSELPWPLDSGGHLRTCHVLTHVARTHEVRLVVPVRDGQADAVKQIEARGVRVVPVPVAPRTAAAEARRLFAARLKGEPYVMYGRHARREVTLAVADEIARRRPAAVYLDHLDSFLFRPVAAAAEVPTVIDLHNVYSLILRRMAGEQPNPVKRWFLRGEANRLARIEGRAARDCSAVLAVSRAEADHFRKLGAKAVAVIPNGVDCAAFAELPTGRPTRPPVVLFLGTMSWGPNVSAAVCLAEQVFPKVRAKLPEAKLLLVGKDPTPAVRALGKLPGVEVTGGVPSVRPYLERASLLAVPLDSGGGTRLKIVEAFAAGLPVVSTAVGAEGIDAADGTEVVIAERPDMADAIVRLLADEARGNGIAAAARELARRVYDWPAIGDECARVLTAAGERPA